MTKLNKKAVATEAITIAMVIFLTIVFTLAYLSIVKFMDKSHVGGIQIKLEETNEETLLLNYLRTPVAIDLNFNVPEKPVTLQETTIADLIILTITEPKALFSLKKESEKILNPYFQDTFFWQIKVLQADQEILVFSKAELGRFDDKKAVYEQDLPTPGPKVYKIQLIKWKD